MTAPTPRPGEAGRLSEDDREALRRAITAFVCNVSNLPEPLQVPALGLNMSPLVDGLTDALAAHVAAERERIARCIRNEAHGQNNREFNRGLLFAADCALAKYDRHDAHSFCIDPEACPRCSAAARIARGGAR